ncbi:hypothetical protein H4Q26_004190 [Puccinia striiformis f. sp. tritici PST-130]|nr:hypothetical protein H4Q26_004190 [Puccinia striiformis f. sp. tritici PST-130]
MATILALKSIEWTFATGPYHMRSLKTVQGAPVWEKESESEASSNNNKTNMEDLFLWTVMLFTSERGFRWSWGPEAKGNTRSFSGALFELVWLHVLMVPCLGFLLYSQDWTDYNFYPQRALLSMGVPSFRGLGLLAGCLHSVCTLFAIRCSFEIFHGTATLMTYLLYPMAKRIGLPSKLAELVNPASFPPYFGSLFELSSLAHFWGKFWHQKYRRAFVFCGGKPAMWLARVLGGSSKVQKACGVVGVFTISGFLHEYPMYAFQQEPHPYPRKLFKTLPASFLFFFVQSFGVILEPLIIPYIPKQIGGPKIWTVSNEDEGNENAYQDEKGHRRRREDKELFKHLLHKEGIHHTNSHPLGSLLDDVFNYPLRTRHNPTQSDRCLQNLTVFIDPSLPTILALQLTALLSHNQAKITSGSTPNLNQFLASVQVEPPTNPADQAGLSEHLIPNLNPRLDLTETTHIITNSLHLPEYNALGRWDDEAGNILSFSHEIKSSQNNGNDEEDRISPDPSKARVYRCIHLVTPLWVTQSYDLNKLLPTGAYSPDPYMFLSGIVIALDSGANYPGLTLLQVPSLRILQANPAREPFEFPCPAILTPRSPSMSADCQHGFDGLPGTKLPPIARKPIEDDSELELRSHKRATEVAFPAQKVSARPVSQGLSDYLEVTDPNSLEDNPSIEHPSKLPQDTQAYREFQDKSVYLVSSLGLSLTARRTLARRIEDLGAKVFDSGDLKLANLTRSARTQKTGWEFWLAWDEGKKIGTLHWILCILNSIDSPICAIRPPTERLLDFPCPPGPIKGCDTNSKPITVTNYTGTVRAYLIRLIENMHLTFSGSLAHDTSMVVAANKAGHKVAFASKGGIQIVNHHYIEDCYQNWQRLSIQAHHLTFPDGVNISESVGQTTRTTDGIFKWTRSTEVKEQRKLDMSVLPSKLTKKPCKEMPSPITPEDENAQPSPLTTVQENENRPKTSESVEEGLAVKRANRKPTLISDSAELSSITSSEIVKVLETPETSSSQGTVTAMQVDDPDLALATPQIRRELPNKRTSELTELDSNPSKKIKKGSTTDSQTADIDTNAPLVRATSLKRLESGDTRKSSTTSTPLQSKPNSSLSKQSSISIKKRANSPKVPVSACRSSTRKAAQQAVKNVKSAAEDMNLHEKEKKRRKRNSSGGGNSLIGFEEDGGYFGEPPKKTNHHLAKNATLNRPLDDISELLIERGADVSRNPKRGRGRRSNESVKVEGSEASGSDGGELPSSIGMNIGGSKKKKKASGTINKKTKDKEEEKEEDQQSSDLESMTLTNIINKLDKKEGGKMKKVKDEDLERNPLPPKLKYKSTPISKSLSTLAGSSSSKKICIAESGVRIDSKISNKLEKMGAKFVESTPSLNDGCTHLLTNKIARTEKFLSCIVLGCFIVNHKWAQECAKRNEFVDETEYELKDTEGEELHDFKLNRSLKIAKRTRKILTDFQIFLTPFVANQNSKLLKKLILLAGGQVLTKIPALEDLQSTADEINKHNKQGSPLTDDDDEDDSGRGGKKSLIISCKEDFKYLKTHLIKKFPRKFLISVHDDDADHDDEHSSSLIKIFDPNLILEGLLVQEIKFEKTFVLDCHELL